MLAKTKLGMLVVRLARMTAGPKKHDHESEGEVVLTLRKQRRNRGVGVVTSCVVALERGAERGLRKFMGCDRPLEEEASKKTVRQERDGACHLDAASLGFCR